jgi:Zn ribbon nucleic-acid-binding protein
MARIRHAACARCSHPYTFHEESGRRSHLLRCVRCGREKQIGIGEVRDLVQRHEKVLTSPLPAGPADADGGIHPLVSPERLDPRRYRQMIEQVAGVCICGAVYRFSARPRCPLCRSTVYRPAGPGSETRGDAVPAAGT